jgi:hypothetical protein
VIWLGKKRGLTLVFQIEETLLMLGRLETLVGDRSLRWGKSDAQPGAAAGLLCDLEAAFLFAARHMLPWRSVQQASGLKT